MRWQLIFAVFISVGCGLWVGWHGALSGLLGVFISLVAGAVYKIIVTRHRGYSARAALRTALRAEAAKITVIVFSLWAVFTVYKDVNILIFIGSFIVAVLIFSMAAFVSNRSVTRIHH